MGHAGTRKPPGWLLQWSLLAAPEQGDARLGKAVLAAGQPGRVVGLIGLTAVLVFGLQPRGDHLGEPHADGQAQTHRTSGGSRTRCRKRRLRTCLCESQPDFGVAANPRSCATRSSTAPGTLGKSVVGRRVSGGSCVILNGCARSSFGRVGMRYMLLIYDCERPEPGDPGFEEALAGVNAFVEECRRRDVFLAGDPLHPVGTATTVRVRAGQELITDGPFAETHEHLGGYYILDCRGLDEALELAALCPMAEVGAIEVRPIAEVPGAHRPLNALRAAVADID